MANNGGPKTQPCETLKYMSKRYQTTYCGVETLTFGLRVEKHKQNHDGVSPCILRKWYKLSIIGLASESEALTRSMQKCTYLLFYLGFQLWWHILKLLVKSFV